MADRPQNFRINYGHQLANGLVFAGLGELPNSTFYKDSSLYKKNGTLTNMSVPATATSGWQWDNYLRRWVMAFDATNDQIVCPSISLTAFTMAAWVWCAVNPNGASPIILGMSDWGGAGSILAIVGNAGTGYNEKWQVRKAISYGSAYALADSAILASKWQHVCGTGDSAGVLNIYLDGILQTGTGTKSGTATSALLLGSGVTGTNPSAKISGDHVVYNRALSVSEISALADPSNSMLSGLILPPKRRLFAAVVGGGETPTFKPAWATKRQRHIGSGVI